MASMVRNHPQDNPRHILVMKSWHAEVRVNKEGPYGRYASGYGFRFGYWPCRQAPYLQLAFHHKRLDIWYGL